MFEVNCVKVMLLEMFIWCDLWINKEWCGFNGCYDNLFMWFVNVLIWYYYVIYFLFFFFLVWFNYFKILYWIMCMLWLKIIKKFFIEILCFLV